MPRNSRLDVSNLQTPESDGSSVGNIRARGSIPEGLIIPARQPREQKGVLWLGHTGRAMVNPRFQIAAAQTSEQSQIPIQMSPALGTQRSSLLLWPCPKVFDTRGSCSAPVAPEHMAQIWESTPSTHLGPYVRFPFTLPLPCLCSPSGSFSGIFIFSFPFYFFFNSIYQ